MSRLTPILIVAVVALLATGCEARVHADEINDACDGGPPTEIVDRSFDAGNNGRVVVRCPDGTLRVLR